VNIPLYIADLLDDHEYVVVPGLGAFISSSCPAQFNDQKTILLPPSRSIYFNPDLKINDGLLTGNIAQKQKITLQQANHVLEQYTSEVMFQLDQGKEVVFDRIGALSMIDGALKFIADISSQENPESFGLNPVAVPELSQGSDLPKNILHDEKRHKKLTPWIWLGSFLLIAVACLSVFFILLDNKPKAPQTKQSIHQDTLKTIKPDTLQILKPVIQNPADTGGIEQPEIQAIQKDSLLIHPGKELYYTIGGSFKSQQNANDYFDRMVLKGFNPIQLGLIGNFYLVALDSFSTANDAFKAANQYSLLFRNNGIWIYHAK
jgi:hypothetical protein